MQIIPNNRTLRELSITKGLIPPPNMAFECTCGQDHNYHSHVAPLIGKAEAPSLIELQLASRPHRWSEIREVQKQFFQNSMQLVTDTEVKILEALKMPDIDTIRRAELTGETEYPGTWQFEEGMRSQYQQIISNWQLKFTGDGRIKQLEDEEQAQQEKDAVYTYFLLATIGAGVNPYKRLFKKELPDGYPPALIDDLQVLVSIENRYLRAIQQNGLSRVKRVYKEKFYDDALKGLRDMAKNGRNPLEAGRWIHANVSEGQAWYWNRIARSESVLALNVVYDDMANQAGVPYDLWLGSVGMCRVCEMFDGNLWERGSGPYPVSDTHPHCNCVRKPQWKTEGRPVRQRWDRPSPYEMPYSGPEGREELTRLEEYFSSR